MFLIEGLIIHLAILWQRYVLQKMVQNVFKKVPIILEVKSLIETMEFRLKFYSNKRTYKIR
jgi:hypothetical protein